MRKLITRAVVATLVTATALSLLIGVMVCVIATVLGQWDAVLLGVVIVAVSGLTNWAVWRRYA